MHFEDFILHLCRSIDLFCISKNKLTCKPPAQNSNEDACQTFWSSNK